MVNPDLLVVGAGITGLSSAFHIKEENPDIEITVIDRAPTFAQGNTARSAAGFRDLFTSDINFRLSNGTIAFYKDIQQKSGFDLGMKFVGYLFLLSEKDSRTDILRSMESKTDLKFYDRSDLSSDNYLVLEQTGEQSRIMGLKNIDVGILGKNCGIIDPDLICNFYYNRLKEMGVEFKFNTNVERLNMTPVNPLNYPGEPFLWQDKTVSSLTTNIGELTASEFLFATDVWTTALLDPLGIDSHVRPKKRQIFQVSGSQIQEMVSQSPYTDSKVYPFTILPSRGVYLRPAPKEKSFWIGVADDIGRDFSFNENPEPEDDFYELSLYQLAQAYIPSIRSSRVTSKWAGYYSYNTIDKTPYIFRSLNLLIATGTSGSGILKGDSIGRVTASAYSRKDRTKLYNGLEIETEKLGIDGRNIDKESIVL
ncbi:MAG: FAD-binding oxidoreductase [Thermoplasmataceae archaeon]|jgi:glycine/D-amino acid oxidase-like deaminating enzyme